MADDTTIAWLRSIADNMDKGFRDLRLELDLKPNRTDMASAVEPLSQRITLHDGRLDNIEKRLSGDERAATAAGVTRARFVAMGKWVIGTALAVPLGLEATIQFLQLVK